MIGGPGEGRTSRTFSESAIHLLYFLPIYLLSTYVFMQLLLPVLLTKKKYFLFALLFGGLFSATCLAISYAGVFYIHQYRGIPFAEVTIGANKYHTAVNGLFIPVTLFGITTGITFSKKWYYHQQENEKLTRQKLATELQLLRTSMHPRFLFHSLQTVQQHIEWRSEESPALILNLSDLLSYILYENEGNWATIKKELDIVQSYIVLEKKGFKGEIIFNSHIENPIPQKFILSTLLLCLIESCFEYAHASNQRHPSVNVKSFITNDLLQLSIEFPVPNTDSPSTIGFEPVFKQLNNKYPGLHQLTIKHFNARCIVSLKLPLYSSEWIGLHPKSKIDEVALDL